MEITAKYEPKQTEDKWYAEWISKGLFTSVPDNREPYTIVIPPPNVTGVLHMGHMLNNTLQDVLIRRARMLGKNACWVPGTDHASIATEAKVVAKLKEQGIEKASLSREQFLEHAWEWTHKYGGIILEQLKKLGASCDWSRTKFTMDKEMSESVIKVFVDLYERGLIYRGVRMVNWDPQARTALSDEEVIYKEVNSKLYYVKYYTTDKKRFITVATTRPETILGDTAVAVHPADPRFEHLKGCSVIVPLVNRTVPVIFDEYVDMEFGTGALKITPAHDINDYSIGIKHNLPVIDIFNDDGTLNEKAELFIGVDRFKARKLSVEELIKQELLVKTEDYKNKVGYSERTNAVIEPRLSMQWFLAMKEISKTALENVLNDEVQLHPAKFKNTYNHWMENVKDWCISRQLWWGQQIPAYYIKGTNDFVIACSAEEALAKAKKKTGNTGLTMADLRQDDDVVDTWFSSWLWPITVFDGIRNPQNNDFRYYYPTTDLVSAHDILFFWIARMIIAGYLFDGRKPFKNVYLTGMVRDKQGRKMSKQLGNSPDPLDLIDKFGADGVRVGMLLCSPAGNDLLFDEALTEQGRNFANKIWNAYRLVSGWTADNALQQPGHSRAAVEWMNARINEQLVESDDLFSKFRISEALMAVYKLFWDDFASWYLEIVKPAYQQPIDKTTFDATIELFDKLLRMLHPFMPFITEELWQQLRRRNHNEYLMISSLPKPAEINSQVTAEFEQCKEIITCIRNIRKEKNIPQKEQLTLLYKPNDNINTSLHPVIIKLAGLNNISASTEKTDGSSFIVNTIEYFIPLTGKINVADETAKIKDELNYNLDFAASIRQKLANERFVNHAPADIVEKEKKKLSDTEIKIQTLQERLNQLRLN